MWILNARQRIMPRDLHAGWIDRDQLIFVMDPDQNPAGVRIVNRVSSAASQRNGGNQFVRRRIHNSIGIAMFV